MPLCLFCPDAAQLFCLIVECFCYNLILELLSLLQSQSVYTSVNKRTAVSSDRCFGITFKYMTFSNSK